MNSVRRPLRLKQFRCGGDKSEGRTMTHISPLTLAAQVDDEERISDIVLALPLALFLLGRYIKKEGL